MVCQNPITVISDMQRFNLTILKSSQRTRKEKMITCSSKIAMKTEVISVPAKVLIICI